MINLIPPYAKKQVKNEYWVRVVSVWAFLAAIALGIVILLLIPSLVLVRSQLVAYEGSYQTASIQNDSHNGLEEEVRTASDIEELLFFAEEQVTMTQFIGAIEEIAINKIMITSMSLERAEDTIQNITVAGSAYSRASLLEFKNAIEGHLFFGQMKLPISNLAKNKDVPFNVTIVVNGEVDQ